MVRRTARLVVLVLVLATCGGEEGATSTAASPATTPPPATTVAPSTSTSPTTDVSSRFGEFELASGRATFMAIAAVSGAADLVANATADAAAGTVPDERRAELLQGAFDAADVADTAMFLYDPEPAVFRDVHAAATTVAADLMELVNAWQYEEIDDSAAAAAARDLADRATIITGDARAILIDELGIEPAVAEGIAAIAFDTLYDDLYFDPNAGRVDVLDVLDIANVAHFTLEVLGTSEFVVAGTLTNTGDVPLEDVRLTIDLFDASGDLIESSEGFPETTILYPGVTVPFTGLLWENEDLNNGTSDVADLAFTATGLDSADLSPYSQEFDIVVEETEKVGSEVTVRGTLTYRGDDPVTTVFVTLAVFDTADRVIGTGTGGPGVILEEDGEEFFIYDTSIVFESGDSAPFQAAAFVAPGRIGRTLVVAEGQTEGP